MSDKTLAYIQPKFKDCQYDSDKSPGTLRQWIGLIGNLVRNIKHGTPIENFLDNYLGRDPLAPAVQPGFLEDSAISLAIYEGTEVRIKGTSTKIAQGIEVDDSQDGLPQDSGNSSLPPLGRGQEKPFLDTQEGDEEISDSNRLLIT